IIPVLIPEKLPPDKPTTRARRINIEVLADIYEKVGIAGIPPHADIPLTNGQKEQAKQIVHALADLKREQESMIPVEQFCAQHLEKLHQFVSEAFRESAAHWQSVGLN